MVVCERRREGGRRGVGVVRREGCERREAKKKKGRNFFFSHLGKRRRRSSSSSCCRLALLCRLRHFFDGLFLSRARRWRLGLDGNSEEDFEGKRKVLSGEHRSGRRKEGHRFFFVDQSLRRSFFVFSCSPTFAVAAFFGAAVLLLFVALVVRLLAPETRSRASERC